MEGQAQEVSNKVVLEACTRSNPSLRPTRKPDDQVSYPCPVTLTPTRWIQTFREGKLHLPVIREIWPRMGKGREPFDINHLRQVLIDRMNHK